MSIASHVQHHGVQVLAASAHADGHTDGSRDTDQIAVTFTSKPGCSYLITASVPAFSFNGASGGPWSRVYSLTCDGAVLAKTVNQAHRGGWEYLYALPVSLSGVWTETGAGGQKTAALHLLATNADTDWQVNNGTRTLVVREFEA